MWLQFWSSCFDVHLTAVCQKAGEISPSVVVVLLPVKPQKSRAKIHPNDMCASLELIFWTLRALNLSICALSINHSQSRIAFDQGSIKAYSRSLRGISIDRLRLCSDWRLWQQLETLHRGTKPSVSVHTLVENTRALQKVTEHCRVIQIPSDCSFLII